MWYANFYTPEPGRNEGPFVLQRFRVPGSRVEKFNLKFYLMNKDFLSGNLQPRNPEPFNLIITAFPKCLTNFFE